MDHGVDRLTSLPLAHRISLTVGGLGSEDDKTVIPGPKNWNPLLVKVHSASAPWLNHCRPQCNIRMAAEIDIAIFENITFHPTHPNFAETIYKKSGQIHQKHTHDQWRSAARVSMSKCTNPCYMTHRVLKARMNYCINQNRPKKKLQAKHRSPLMPLAARHSFSKGSKCFLAALRYQVQGALHYHHTISSHLLGKALHKVAPRPSRESTLEAL